MLELLFGAVVSSDIGAITVGSEPIEMPESELLRTATIALVHRNDRNGSRGKTRRLGCGSCPGSVVDSSSLVSLDALQFWWAHRRQQNILNVQHAERQYSRQGNQRESK